MFNIEFLIIKNLSVLKILLLSVLFLPVYGQNITVIRVLDGDTFETSENEKIRLIGINTPEKNDIYFEESKNHLIKYILNKNVTLIKDKYSSNRDRNGRLLRYIHIGNEDINLAMIRDGYAFAYLKYRFERSETYKQEQLNANYHEKGMWKSVSIEHLKNDSGISIKNNSIESPTNSIAISKSTKSISYKGHVILFLILILISIGLVYSLKK